MATRRARPNGSGIYPDRHHRIAGAISAVRQRTGKWLGNGRAVTVSRPWHPFPTRPSPSASPDSRRTSARPRPRRPARCCAWRRRAPARRRRWSPGWRGSWTAARTPGRSCIVAFNKRAAEELTARLDAALAPLGVAGGLRAGPDVPRPRPRDPPRRGRGRGAAGGPGRGAARPVPRHHAGGPRTARPRVLAAQAGPARHGGRGGAGPGARAGRPRLRRLRGRRPGAAASTSTTCSCARSRACTRTRACSPAGGRAPRRLLVDEAQDLDRTQLELALLLAAPANDVFLVGDDDQTIYSWRLADVRRVLGLAASLPGLRRVDLETNYRCPPPVVARAVRLVEHNRERFAKRILAGSTGGRTARPRPGRRRRRRARPAGDGLVAGRRLDPRRARPDQPGAAGRGGRRAGARDPVPGAGPRRSRSRTRAWTSCSTGRRPRPWTAPRGPGAGPRSPPRPRPAPGGAARRGGGRATRDADEATAPADLATALLGWAAAHPSIAALRGGRGGAARPPRRAPPGRRGPHARDRPRDEGPRVGPRRSC